MKVASWKSQSQERVRLVLSPPDVPTCSPASFAGTYPLFLLCLLRCLGLLRCFRLLLLLPFLLLLELFGFRDGMGGGPRQGHT